MKKALLFVILLFLPIASFAKSVEDRALELPVCDEANQKIVTCYGTFEVTDPVIWELLNSPAMQRLKEVHQYGISKFVDSHVIQYSRFDHSVGVWALLRLYGASPLEQIAGLLHDASHTVFSHTTDYLFKDHLARDSYQDDIHSWYLKQQGIDKILEKHGIHLEQVLPKTGDHVALEQELPDLCADRIEYNIQEGLMIDHLTKEELPELLASLHYEDGRWYFSKNEYAKKLAFVSIHGTLHQWGGPDSYMQNRKTAILLRYALDQGYLTLDDIHFSHDAKVWKQLHEVSDPQLQMLLQELKAYKKHPEGISLIRTKLRAIDPLVKDQMGSLVRLSSLDKSYAIKYQETKERVTNGWTLESLVKQEA